MNIQIQFKQFKLFAFSAECITRCLCPWQLQQSTTGGNARGALCIFPFQYKDKLYTSCTSIDHNIPWCATTANYNVDKICGECTV
uniref:Fibronectin type-II domain-containing protein n=1 Tax=Denticeps clupeoides TaxID=299321 RepID=A0A8C4AS69_9TELE